MLNLLMIWLMICLTSLAIAPLSRGAPPMGPTVQVGFDDALGAKGQIPWPGMKATLVIFTSKESEDDTRKRVRTIQQSLFDETGIEFVSVVDTRPYSSFFLKQFASGALRRHALDCINTPNEFRQKEGLSLLTAESKNFHLVGDWEGEIHTALRVSEEDPRPTLFVVDKNGKSTGPYRGPESANAVIAAVYNLLSRRE